MTRTLASLTLLGLLVSGCATSAAHRGATATAQPDGQSTQRAAIRAQGPRPRKQLEPDEHYRRVMERARRRNIRVIWVHPPTHAAANHVSPPQTDQ